MNILQWVMKNRQTRKNATAMASFYKAEYGSQWRQYQRYYPTATDSQIAEWFSVPS